MTDDLRAAAAGGGDVDGGGGGGGRVWQISRDFCQKGDLEGVWVYARKLAAFYCIFERCSLFLFCFILFLNLAFFFFVFSIFAQFFDNIARWKALFT